VRENCLLRRSRHLVIGLVVLAAALLAFGAGLATSEPAAIQEKRAEVQRIQSELASIDAQVGQAAEAYNGARYELGQVEQRIEQNRDMIVSTKRDLVQSRKVLAERLRDLYATPEPTLAEVLITSGSIAAAADQLDLLDRVGQQDATVVSGLRDNKKRLENLRAELLVDREKAAEAVERAEREKAKVEELLRQRQAVLSNVKGELAQMLRAEEERERREAAAAAALARQRQAAAAAAAAAPSSAAAPSVAPAAADPAAPAAPAAPSAPLPSGGGNAAAASIAMQYLGVPYVWGGASPSGFDCSGLASYAFAQIGKSVPHYTGAIWNAFPKVPSDQLQPGDMVFFNGLGHMGIYIGGGQYVHAPHTGDVVKVSSLGDRSDYMGAVRA
jgi:cell wall-associated NlpC family hydrolase